MAVLKAKQRNKLKKSSFAVPGKRAYPINDAAHARNALARVAQHGTPAEKARVRAAVKKKFPNIDVSGKKKKAKKTSEPIMSARMREQARVRAARKR
jgi:hypothetical protein